MAPQSSNTRGRRRAAHAGVVAAVGGASSVLSWALLPDRATARAVLSVATAYASLGLLTVTLVVGPWNVLAGRPNPVSQDLRRDAGVGSATLALTHVVLSFGNHFSGRISRYFFESRVSVATLRTGAFGLGVWTGLGATLIVIVLALTSNDRSVRRLGRRWKRVQRWNYLLAVLTVAHMVAFWSATSRALPFVVAGAAATIAAAAFQALGYVRRSGGSPAQSSR